MVRSDAGTVVQLNGYSDLKCLALAVTSDGNIDQLGDGDDGDLSVQDDAEKGFNLKNHRDFGPIRIQRIRLGQMWTFTNFVDC